MKPLFLSDLDDTLFTTARKITDAKIDECTVASTLVDGSPSGYRTPKLQQLHALMSVGEVVPVTARGRDVLARCEVPQAPAICSNGGVIVRSNGEIDRSWHDEIVANIGNRSAIDKLHDNVRTLAGDEFRNWTVDEEGAPLYICFKHNGSDEYAVKKLQTAIEQREIMPSDWAIHRNGNNLALMPPWISKRRAARHLIDEIRKTTPHRLIIGMGDSISDLGFMAECDFAMHPASSQIGLYLAVGHKW